MSMKKGDLSLSDDASGKSNLSLSEFGKSSVGNKDGSANDSESVDKSAGNKDDRNPSLRRAKVEIGSRFFGSFASLCRLGLGPSSRSAFI